MEQLSIFQNKEVNQFKTVKLNSIKGNKQESAQDFNDYKKYTKKLELTIESLNDKLIKLKSELEQSRADIVKLKASNDNMLFINEKLNKAYMKMLSKNDKLTSSIDQSSILTKSKVSKHKKKTKEKFSPEQIQEIDNNVIISQQNDFII